MRYEIEDNNTVKIYDDINPEPFWLQPTYPNGDSFDSVEEATIWAELAIASQLDDSAPYPPNGKGQDGLPKPTAEELREAKLQRLGLSVDDLKILLGIN
jgi:hypothetical protein